MSPGFRGAVGCVTLLGAVGFALAAIRGIVTQNVWLLWVLVTVCLLTTLSCIPGRHFAVTGRLVGAAIALGCLAYLIAELPHFSLEYEKSKPGLINAVLAMINFGLPGAYVAIYGRLPSRSHVSSELPIWDTLTASTEPREADDESDAS